jgi:hypothetical protein
MLHSGFPELMRRVPPRSLHLQKSYKAIGLFGTRIAL